MTNKEIEDILDKIWQSLTACEYNMAQINKFYPNLKSRDVSGKGFKFYNSLEILEMTYKALSIVRSQFLYELKTECSEIMP